MRISDWSSDVCSSDLSALRRRHSAGVGCFYRIGAAPFDPGTHREAHGTWLSQAGRRRNPSRPPRRPTRLLAQARRSGPLASGESLKWLQIEMEQNGMRKKIELTRRHFVGATASTIAEAPFRSDARREGKERV